MWTMMVIVVLGFLIGLASLWYVRKRADEEEAASEQAAVRQAHERVMAHRQDMTSKSWQHQLDDERQRVGRRW